MEGIPTKVGIRYSLVSIFNEWEVHRRTDKCYELIECPPTIAYQSILQMFVVKMTFTYTLGVPLNILPGLAGDFDQNSVA